MKAWHQKNFLEPDFPFFLGFSKSLKFSHHWHEEIEIIYIMQGRLQAGINHEVYPMGSGDILLIGAGDVHHFIPQSRWCKTAIIQFGFSIFESFSTALRDRRFICPFFGSLAGGNSIEDEGVTAHQNLEKEILSMIAEYRNKREGYQMALKARLYDLIVTILRQVPMEKYSSRERAKQLKNLEKLEQVFCYVEKNHIRTITLDEIAKVANFSTYHFTRFFRETTGITFNRYLNYFRIRKAEVYLRNIENSVTEVAFKSGFNSIKTFNRVFKEVKGCSPSEYRKNHL